MKTREPDNWLIWWLGRKETWKDLFMLPFAPLAALLGGLLLHAAFHEYMTCGEGPGEEVDRG